MTTEFLDALEDQRLVAIIREHSADAARDLGERYIAAGVRLIEVSLVTPGAIGVIHSLSATARGTRTLIGGGTVLTVPEVHDVAVAGGSFILSPVLDDEVVTTALAIGLAVVPGCATPTEFAHAADLGASAIKIFPASLWSPATMKDVLQALPHLGFLPTGGIDRTSIPAWLAAGAVGVGLGSALSALDADGVAELLAQARL